MKKRFRLFAVVLTVFVFQACASSGPYHQDQEIGVDYDFWQGRQFTQKGAPVDSSQVMQDFKTDPKTKDVVDGIEPLQAGAVLFGASGGFMFGYGLGSLGQKDGGQPVLIATGAVAIVIGALLSSKANEKLGQALDIHNGEVRKKELQSKPSQKKTGGLTVLPGGLAWQF